MLGSHAARVAPFNVNYRYVDDELLYLLEDADAVGLVFHARYASTLARIRDRLPRLRLLLQVDDGSGERLLPDALDYEAALAAASPVPPDAACSPDDLYILYTGGTTAAPKGVLWRQEDIYFGAMSGQPPGVPPPATIPELVGRAANGAYLRTLPTPPLMHGAAQWAAFAALHQGGAVVLQARPDRLDPDDIWGTVAREGVNLLLLVGDAFARPLLDGLDRRSYAPSRPFVLFSGGAVPSPPPKQALLERIPPQEGIAGLGAAPTRGGPAPSPPPAGSPEVGWVAGTRHVPLGYYKDAAKTARTFPIVGGTRYAVPGDHGRILADGSIVVLGRGSVSINTGGEKVYPEEVEQALRRHPSIYDAVVVGTPDERFGEQVTAVAQLRPGAHATHEELVDLAARHLARYKLPKTTVWVDEITRSPSGKPDYRWARARALAARGLAPA